MQSKKSLPISVLATLALLALAVSCRSGNQQDTHLHAADVPVRPLVHFSTDSSAESFAMQVAILQTKEEEGMLGLVHALKEMGIPFFITRDFDQAIRHPLVIVYPGAEGRAFDSRQVRQLGLHVSNGGSVLSFNVSTGSLKSLFGFREAVPSRRRHRVMFCATSDPIEQYLNRPEEREVPLGNSKYDEIFWTNGYSSDGTSEVLANFDDGTAAVLRKKLGTGTSYLFGLSFQDVILRNQINRDYDAERHYANAFEPGSDVWMLALRAWYESAQPGAVRLGTVPGAKKSVLLLSHDVDWEDSFGLALEFSAMEEKHHVKSTFFIQTKYVSDANSVSFFSGKNLADLRTMQAQGFSIGSHSVIHSRGFNKFELGAGTETFATYQPRGTGFDSATGANVFGEIRVSKQLLDGELPGQQTVFFRAGHLRVPPTMPEVLQRCGYLFDSSFTAPDVLTNFPYLLPLGLGFEEESGILEFPLTFEDEQAPRLDLRVSEMLEVIRANAENEAINVILIHTNEAHYKLMAEEDLLNTLPEAVIATDALTFAHFWRAREHVKWAVTSDPSISGVRLTVTTTEPVEGLTFEFQRDLKGADSGAVIAENHHQLIMRPLKAGERLTVDISYSH
jgi:polysaccharide deacetylase